MDVNINGYNINYKISGEGNEIVIILQGWGTKLDMYDSIANIMKKKYQVVQFDFPGFGLSDEPHEAWNVESFADFFCEFVQKLNIKKTILIGHSYGGRVIIKLASRRSLPFKINKIVLIDSAGILHDKSIMEKIKIRKYKILKKIFSHRIMYILFPELIDDWKSRQGSSDYKNATPIMRECLVLAVNEDLTELLPKIKQDTLLIWGDQDTATPIGDGKIMEKIIPNAGLVILEGAGHFSFIEKPIIFKNVIESYFKIGVK